MNRIVDLRSDTVTQPSAEMRRAMAAAEVGDDYYREDATVRRLEEQSAGMLGKEAALLVLSGTMGNLVSLLTLAQRGDSVLTDERAHIFINEGGNLAGVAGVTVRTFKGIRGFPSSGQVRDSTFPRSVLHPPTRVLCLENTHNAAGGTCLDVASLKQLSASAQQLGLKIHLDGARLFNAAAALGVPASELAAPAESTTFCLTKGLGCPVGSLVVGSRAFVEQARHWRHHVGGNMRQAGVFAAAGLVGLTRMVDRLSEDHENARLLAQRLAEADWQVDPAAVETNMVFASFEDTEFDLTAFVAALGVQGIRISPPKGRRLRLVTHAGITRDDVIHAADLIANVYKGTTPRRSEKSDQ